MLSIVENPDTKVLSSMKVNGGSAKRLVEISNLKEFQTFVNTLKDEKVICIGEGTNTIFINQNPNLVLLKLNLKEISPTQPSPQGRALVQVEAGVNWDEFVQKYISLGGVGMESLSAIPGTVGAAPVQNIGAYGQEVSNFIDSVKVYDLEKKEFRTLENSKENNQCEFSYRDSLFKNTKNRYIILSVIFEIKKGEVKIPEYKDVQNYFNLKGKVNGTEDLWKTPDKEAFKDLKATVQEIRDAIISIRGLKFPSVHEIPNSGSFFKNPIIPNQQLKKVKEFFPEIPIYKTPVENFIKIPAGYILERLGYKSYNQDYSKGSFCFYKNHALMITSNGKGDVQEFLEFVKSVKQKVFETCGVELEEEVNLV